MESAWVLCKKDNNDRQPWLRLSARATASRVDHISRTLSAGGVPLDKRIAQTEALEVILLRCLYRRDAEAAVNLELVLCALGLFVGTRTEKDVSVITKAL